MKVYKILLMIGRLIWQPKKLPYLRKMKVRFTDNGQTIEAENNLLLVEWMRKNSFTTDKSNKEYMLSYAQRAVINNNEDIRATNEDEFVNDLIKLNHLQII